MFKWIPLTLAAAALLLVGCKKSEPPRMEPAPDTAMVLPEPPELDPLEDAFPEEPESVAAPEPPAKPEKPKPDPRAGIVKNGPYVLQVGIYNNERQAGRLVEKLKGQGFPAYASKVVDPTPALTGTFHRVRIGSFASVKAARAYGEIHLAPQGIDYWADLKGRDTLPVKQVFKPQEAAVPAPAPAEEPAPASGAAETPPAAEDTAQKLPDW